MTKATLLVHVTGEAPRVLRSKRTGNEFTLTEIYVRGAAPFPEKVSVFDDVRLESGYYHVPYVVKVLQERLQVVLDFNSATRAQTK